MREIMAEDGTVDAAASYRDPRAVPLRDAAKLLDLVYAELDDDQLRDQIAAPRLIDGRFRIIGYEKPRRLSDEPVLVVAELVKAAFQDLRCGLVFDPLHDRVVRHSIAGTPSALMLREMPDLREKLHEHQRLAALPPAIDWTGCAVRAGRYAFVNCKAIRAADLSIVDLVSEVAEGPEATQAEELPHDLPPPTEGRLREVLKAILIENQAWEGAGAPKLRPLVRARDPRFGAWSDSYLEKLIKKVKGDALRDARLARKTAGGG